MVTIKHHRIDSGKKALVLNLKLVRIWPLLLNPFWSCWGLFVVCSSVNLRLLLFSLRSWQLRMRCPTSLLQTIHRHYDDYKAENSGSLGVPNGVWSFLGDFPYVTFWKILFSIDPLSFKPYICDKWIFYQLRSTLRHPEVWVLCSVLLCKKGIWEVSWQKAIWRNSRCEGGYHTGLLQTFDWGENILKKNLVPLMATESLATTCFLDSHPGQDFERKAGREATTKLKDIGSCAVYICSSFFNVMVKDSINM